MKITDCKIKLSPPWVTLANEIKAMFGGDPDIKVEYEDNPITPMVKMLVSDKNKALAISRLIGKEFKFGDVTLRVDVEGFYPNVLATEVFHGREDIVSTAFRGNPAVAVVRPVSKGLFKDLIYVAFKKEVVQFPNDDMTDINGNWSGLYADIADDIFIHYDYIFYCTASDNGFGAQLGEWP